MSYTKYVLGIIASLCCFYINSQNNFEGLGETGFSANYSVDDTYKLNFSLKSRYYLYERESTTLSLRQLDFVHFSSFNLDRNNTLSLGIQYRVREPIDGGENELRITEQYNFNKKNLALRFGHRFRFEQRILRDLTILRSRYRFTLDFPLNGEKLDVGETYLITSLEFLMSNGKKIKPQLDQRSTAQIGWFFSKQLKFQLGVEYRFEEFNILTEEKLFILSSVILKL